MAVDRRQIVSNVAAFVAVLLWLGCGVAAAVAMWRQGALVAVGWERFVLPLALGATNLPLALLLEVQRRAIRRWVPLWSALMVLVPPALTFAVIWLPGLTARHAPPAAAVSPRPAGPHIVLLTMDSFRADHLGVLSGGSLTPELDALAASGLLYTQAVTTAPLSGPAHASMLTGKGVLEHGLTLNGAAVKVPTLVEQLRAKGYRTGAFVSAQVIDRDSALHLGFHHYDDRWGIVQRLAWLPALAELGLGGRPPRRSGNETVDRALAWLEGDDTPAFLWVHLYDAHGPYAPPTQFQPPMETLDQARRMDRDAMRRAANVEMIGNRPRSRVREQTILYSAAIRWVDALAGRLVKRLPAETIVLAVGDHGESLGEHEYFFSHGAAVWEPAIRIPLIVRWPGRFPGGTRFDGLTSVSSVYTLLRQGAGIEPKVEPTAEGSVFVYTTGQDAGRVDGEEVSTKRSPPTACVRRDGVKILRSGKEPAAFFDLRADPEELQPLPVPPEYNNDVLLLEQILSKPVPRLDEAQRARLEALGYQE